MAIRNTNLGGIDYQDTGSTQLNGAINNSVTTITVDSTTGFKSGGGTIRIDDELIDYTGVTSTTFTGCTRGQYGTSAASHLDNANVLEREVVKAEDINDTFDAASNVIKTLTAFWLNSDLYDVLEDWSSFSVGNIVSVSSLTSSSTTISGYFFSVQCSGSGSALNYSATISVAENSYGASSGKDIILSNVGSTTSFSLTTTSTIDMPVSANKHKYIRFRWSHGGNDNSSSNTAFTISFGGTLVETITRNPRRNSATIYHDLLFIAKGSDTYDIYLNGRQVQSDFVTSSDSIRIQVSWGSEDASTSLVIDKIIESKSGV